MNINQTQYNYKICIVIRAHMNNYCMLLRRQRHNDINQTNNTFFNVVDSMVKLKVVTMKTKQSWRRMYQKQFIVIGKQQNNNAGFGYNLPSLHSFCNVSCCLFKREFIIQDSVNIYQRVCEYSMVVYECNIIIIFLSLCKSTPVVFTMQKMSICQSIL